MSYDSKTDTLLHIKRKSIEINKDRFKINEQICDIFTNTAERLGYEKQNVKK